MQSYDDEGDGLNAFRGFVIAAALELWLVLLWIFLT